MHPFRLARRAAALALLLIPFAPALGGGAAAAERTPMAGFYARFAGERVAAWSEPRWETAYDCDQRRWTEGDGGERWQVGMSRPTPLIVWVPSYGGVRFQIGTLNPREITEQTDLHASAMIERRNRRLSGWYANDRCGPASDGLEPPPRSDCGTRLPRQDVGFWEDRGRLELSITNARGDDLPRPFLDCQLFEPFKLPIDSGWSMGFEPIVPIREILDPTQRTVRIQASRSWRDVVDLHGKGTRHQSVSTRWTLTLVRAPLVGVEPEEPGRRDEGRGARGRGRGRGRGHRRGRGRAPRGRSRGRAPRGRGRAPTRR